MQTIINSAVSVADIKKAAAEGWTPSQVLGAIRLVTWQKAQKLQNIQDSLESRVFDTFKDKALDFMLSMPYGPDDDEVTAEEWQLLCDWYDSVLHRRHIYVTDQHIAEVLHIEVSTTLNKVADVIRQEWELFGLDKI